MTTLMKPEEEELTTSTEDLSLPLSLDKKVWLSLRSNCRARLLNAILEELIEVRGQRRSEVIGSLGGGSCSRFSCHKVTNVTSAAGVN